MFQPGTLFSFSLSRDSKVAKSIPPFSSCCEKTRRASGKSWESEVAALWRSKPARHVRPWWNHICTLKRPRRSTTVEQRDPSYYRKASVPRFGKLKAHPSMLYISSGDNILSRRLMHYNSPFTTTNVTYLPDSLEKRADHRVLIVLLPFLFFSPFDEEKRREHGGL